MEGRLPREGSWSLDDLTIAGFMVSLPSPACSYPFILMARHTRNLCQLSALRALLFLGTWDAARGCLVAVLHHWQLQHQWLRDRSSFPPWDNLYYQRHKQGFWKNSKHSIPVLLPSYARRRVHTFVRVLVLLLGYTFHPKFSLLLHDLCYLRFCILIVNRLYF